MDSSSTKRNGRACEVCGKLFAGRGSLAQHRKTHDDPETRKIACSACNKLYLTKGGLEGHIRKAHNVQENDKSFICTYCGKRFWNNAALNSHTLTHTGERPFPCKRCKIRFALKGNLVKHVHTVHRGQEEQPHTCQEPGCGKLLRDPSTLKKHLAKHNSIMEANPCPSCDKVYSLKQGLASHIKCSHGDCEKTHVCTYCGKRFRSHGRLLRHTRSHTGEKPYACALCRRTFSDAGGRRTHEAHFHGDERPHGCPQRGNRFKLRIQLNRHVETHKPKEERRTFPCEICGKKFATNASLKNHMTGVHRDAEELNHICPICKKRFGRHGVLSKHVRSHTGEKPYTCSICPRKFGQPGYLRYHEANFHSEARPHGCQQCEKRFKNVRALNAHLQGVAHKSKSERQMFECAECGKKLLSKVGLKMHMTAHTHPEQKQHPCPICGKKFSIAGNLKRHAMIHTGEKLHICSECGKSFLLREHLKLHQRNIHKRPM